MTKIPEITIATHSDNDYVIMGWDDFDWYARNNLPLYRSLVDATSYMSETDRLRVMLWHYVNEAEMAKSMYLKAIRDNPPEPLPVMGPNGEVYRYVGP